MKAKFVKESYEDLKLRHPEWNWEEAEMEISDDDLEAAADHFDRISSGKKVNEEFGQKDLVRMQDIRTKSAGDHEKELSLAATQAKIITNAAKAKARAEAAEEVFGPGSDIAEIFNTRAQELGGSYVRAEASKGVLAPVKAAVGKGEKLEREFKKHAILPSERIRQGNAEEKSGGFSRTGDVFKGTGIGRYATAVETGNDYNYQPASILPIGRVNFGTGECKFFNVKTTWPDSLIEIWSDGKNNKAIFTSGSKPSEKIGNRRDFRHDQNWQMIGRGWKLIDYAPMKDITELIRLYGGSLSGYTYK